MGSLGLNDGEPGRGLIVDVHVVFLVGGHGELELAAGSGSLGAHVGHGSDAAFLDGNCLDVALALVVVGEDENLAFNLGRLGSLGIGGRDGNHDVTAHSVNLDKFGSDAGSGAEDVHSHLVGGGNTLYGVLESDGFTGVCADAGEVTFIADLQGEGLLLRDLDLGLAHDQNDIILGGLAVVNIGRGEGGAVDYAEAEGFPGFTVIVGNDDLSFGAGAEQRSDTILALVTFVTIFTLITSLALVALVTLGGNRQRVAGLVFHELAVDGPVVDTVLAQSDADNGSLGVVAVLAVVTIFDNGGGSVSEVNGVLTIPFNNRLDCDLVVHSIHQILQTRDCLLVDFVDCVLEGGDPLVQIADLILEVRQIGLLGAAYRQQRYQRGEQYSPNGFFHND